LEGNVRSQQFFDRLRRHFAADAVPAAYVDGLIEELQLHFEASVNRHLLGGLTGEQAEAAALAGIGTEKEIVRATLDTLRRERFMGRHRFLCLVFLPTALLLGYQFLVLQLERSLVDWLSIGPARLWGLFHQRLLGSDFSLEMALYLFTCNLILPLVLIRALWKAARRNFCGWAYTMVGCAILLHNCYHAQMRYLDPGTEPPSPSWVPSGYQLSLVSICGLMLVVWQIRRNKRAENQLVLHSSRA
jgi:hypothetical protein